MNSLRLVLLFAMCLHAVPAWAVEIEGVDLPREIRLDSGESLQLNGAGIRKKFFIKVYIGALYLGSPQREVQAVLDAPGAKRVFMHILYDELSRSKLVDAWNDGFESNLDDAELASLRGRIERFNAMFDDVRAGDTLSLTFLPASGTHVEIAGVERGVVPGDDFFRALLKIWLGDHPADGNLKDAMLGRE